MLKKEITSLNLRVFVKGLRKYSIKIGSILKCKSLILDDIYKNFRKFGWS